MSKEKLHLIHGSNFDFAIYQLPGQSRCWFIGQDSKNRNSNYSLGKDKGFIIHPFDSRNKECPPVFIRPEIFKPLDQLTSSEVEVFFLKNSTNKKSNSTLQEYSQAEYLNRLTDAIEKMNESEIDKFIFSRIDKQNKSIDALKLVEQLSFKYPNAFVYYFHLNGIGSWIAATPEILAKYDGDSFTTFSLAGTQKAKTNGDKKYIWGAKEQQEQAFVTQFIKETFEKLEIDHIVSDTKTHKAGPVVHLLSEIKSNSNQLKSSLDQLIHKLHPTPAVCGLPKEKALEFISKIESHKRQYYCGFLGPVWLHNKIELYVNLRCMQIFENYLALYLGGGITKDSIPQKEWQETCDKAETLLSIL